MRAADHEVVERDSESVEGLRCERCGAIALRGDGTWRLVVCESPAGLPLHGATDVIPCPIADLVLVACVIRLLNLAGWAALRITDEREPRSEITRRMGARPPDRRPETRWAYAARRASDAWTSAGFTGVREFDDDETRGKLVTMATLLQLKKPISVANFESVRSVCQIVQDADFLLTGLDHALVALGLDWTGPASRWAHTAQLLTVQPGVPAPRFGGIPTPVTFDRERLEQFNDTVFPRAVEAALRAIRE